MGRSAPWSALGSRSRISGVGVARVSAGELKGNAKGASRQQERSLNPRSLRASTDGARASTAYGAPYAIGSGKRGKFWQDTPPAQGGGLGSPL
eukprot:6685751-Prymnesium_polylepis.2